ncbi:MAG: redox-regulated ATPase YchF [Chloroflexi bacterium]|nr:MAG: redox-regulated ATPase YchF [Chloroflexota bacterium]
MPVSVAIVGPPGVGKTTLFNALTGGRGSGGVGMVDVPDERLDRLVAAVRPKKVVHAQVRIADAPPGSRAQQVAAAREADVVLQVARCFGPEPDPLADITGTTLDMVLADLATVERRLEIAAKEAQTGRASAGELEVLVRARAQLDAGAPLRKLELDGADRAALAPLFPVTLKPVVWVANVADNPAAGEPVVRAAREEGTAAAIVAAALEAELAELDPAEAREYRRSYGLESSGLDEIVRAVWRAGGLITFFTAGEPEARAWPCEEGAPAPVAAGKIHSDFEKKFIRAEVTSVDELVAAGSMDALRAAGKLRVEGRDYRVKDGDVVLFRVGS